MKQLLLLDFTRKFLKLGGAFVEHSLMRFFISLKDFFDWAWELLFEFLKGEFAYGSMLTGNLNLVKS